MARRAQPLRLGILPGILALAFVLALGLGSFAAVVLRAEGPTRFSAADWAALKFTLLQAFLSATLCIALGIPIARALARRQFLGRRFLIVALGAPFILPVIVAVMGLLATFGRSGVVNQALGWLGMPPVQIYGLQGVLLAHVFLNLPLAVRLILNGWAAIPAERFRLAASLDFAPRDIWRLVEKPMLRSVLPGTALAIFLICLASFTVALTMGGGPKATTLELAIYQSFRMEFDLAHAATLASVQMVLSLVAAGTSLAVVTPAGFGTGSDRGVERWDGALCVTRLLDSLWLGVMSLFLAVPILLIVLNGLPGLLDLPASIWPAAARSVSVALGSTVLAMSLSLAIGIWITSIRRQSGRIVDALAMLTLTASPLVLGTGLFLILRPTIDPVRWALLITVVVNAAMALPFALRAILPGLHDIRENYARLAESLDLRGIAWVRYLILPRLCRPLWFAAGLSAALSMGDLGVITLFADPERATLPMEIYGLMGAYKMDIAAGAALVLVTLSFGLFWMLDRRGHRDADT